MKRSLFRSLVCLLLVLSMVLPLLPDNLSVALAASNYVAFVNGTYYTSYSDAWNAVCSSSSGTISMLTDWDIGGRLTVPENHTVTLNMNGHVINRKKTNTSKMRYASDSGGNGTAFFISEGAKLTINGGNSELVHKGSLYSDIWYYDGKGSVSFNGGLITGCATDSDAGAITLHKKNAELIMNNVTMAGNVSDTYLSRYGIGACIKLWAQDGIGHGENGKVTLNNCNLSYNYACDGGGAIAVDDHTNAKIKLNNCTLSYNTTNNGKGGAILFNDGSENGELELYGTTISNNSAKYGGGIYIYDQSNAIRGGNIINNYASENGGGIWIGQEDCTLTSITVTGNKAAKWGGGVFLDSSNKVYVPKTQLTGNIIIKENYETSGRKSDLYLDDGNAFDRMTRIYGVPGIESEIWVRTGRVPYQLSYTADSYNDNIFHSDDSNYSVYWDQDKNSSTYRYLMLGNESQTSKDADINVKLPLAYKDPKVVSPGKTTATEKVKGTPRISRSAYYNYNGWPVYAGFSMQDEDSEAEPYYYSDGYFLSGDPEKYDKHLASMALRVAASAFNLGASKDYPGTEWEYKLRSSHAKQLFSDIGCADEDIYLSDTYFVKPDKDTIAYAIGSKPLLNQDGTDSGKTLVIIAVRGAGYEAEWASNMTLGEDESTEHSGFSQAATNVINGLNSYIAKHSGLQDQLDKGNVRFLVTGFSRAGATSNITSKRLIDTYQAKGNVIYGYPFEAPQGGVPNLLSADSNYKTIHNTLLSGDLVPYVAMSVLGFQRYGVDHYLDGPEAGNT